MPFISDDSSFAPTSWVSGEEELLERSALVAVCVALVACGSLLGSSVDHALPGLSLSLPLLAVAVEEEIRRFRVPGWIGFSALSLHLLWLAAGPLGNVSAILLALSSAVILPALLLPLYGAGLIRLSTLATAAALGAIWGMDALPSIVLWSLFLGVPFAMIRIALRANPKTLPVLPAIALAATMHQLFV